ncbi:MAG: hypothetical protein K0S47_1200 [Herbinix sp.]|nr:hypothetical protein [Herbinix sp.]
MNLDENMKIMDVNTMYSIINDKKCMFIGLIGILCGNRIDR